VRDASAIGQILACPKCQGMVLVEPQPTTAAAVTLTGTAAAPPVQNAASQTPLAGGQTAAADMAGAEATFEYAARLLAGEAPAEPPPVDTPSVETPPPAASAPTSPGSPPVASTLPVATGGPVAPPPIAARVDPPVESPVATPGGSGSAFSESVPRGPGHTPATGASSLREKWLTVGGVATSAALMLIALGLAVFSRDRDSAAIAAAPDPQQSPAELEAALGVSSTQRNPRREAPAPADNPRRADDNPPPVAAPSEPVAQPPGVAPPSVTTTLKPVVLAEPQGAAGPRVPPRLEPAPTEPTQAKAATARVPGAARALVARVPYGFLDSSPAEPPQLARPAAPLASPGQMRARLATPLPKIESPPIALGDFLRFLSDIVGAPISIRPDALRYSGARLQDKISLNAADTTVGELARQVLAAKNLALQIEGGELALVDRRTTGGQHEHREFNVVELVGSSREAGRQLADWLQTLLANDLDGGQVAVRSASLTVSGPPKAHLETAILLERLRKLRDAASSSSWAANPTPARWASAGAALNRKITVTHIRKTPLPAVIDSLAKAAGVDLLVDWGALAAAGVSAETALMFSANKEPLSKTLDRLLAPRGLAYRVVGARVLEITSARRAGQDCEVEFYSLERLVSPSQSAGDVMEAVRGLLGAEQFQNQGGRWALAYDAESGTLAALLPQPRQRDVARLLHLWSQPAPSSAGE